MATLSQEQRLSIKKISNDPIVENISSDYYRVRVKFKTGITENWILREGNKYQFSHKFPLNKLFSKHGLPIYSEFETHPLDEDEYRFLKPFFIIQRKDIRRAGFVDTRLVVHRIIDRLLSEGWIALKYPRDVLEQERQAIKDINFESFFTAPEQVGAYNTVGRAILEHFLDWGHISNGRQCIADAWRSPSHLYASIQSILDGRRDVTRTNIVRHLSISGGRRNCGPKFINPGIYCATIKTFMSPPATIYDHEPGVGSKLFAASLLGASYATSELGELAGVASFLSCKIADNDNYDLSILSDINPIDAIEAIKLLEEFTKKSKNILIMIGKDDLDKVSSKYKPRRILKAQMCPKVLADELKHHYFLIY